MHLKLILFGMDGTAALVICIFLACGTYFAGNHVCNGHLIFNLGNYQPPLISSYSSSARRINIDEDPIFHLRNF